MKKICACEVVEERSNQRTVFRIVRSSKDGSFKNIDFEAPTAEASKGELCVLHVPVFRRLLHVHLHVHVIHMIGGRHTYQ